MDDYVRENVLRQCLLVDNTNVHLLLLVMNTVAVQMYYNHNVNMDGNVVDDACFLS